MRFSYRKIRVSASPFEFLEGFLGFSRFPEAFLGLGLISERFSSGFSRFSMVSVLLF